MTANQQYRQYKKGGGQLSFAEYMTREKKKAFLNLDGSADIPTNKPLTDSINNVLDQLHKQAGYQDQLTNKYIFGINKNVWIGAGIVLVVTVSAVIVHHKMKKK